MALNLDSWDPLWMSSNWHKPFIPPQPTWVRVRGADPLLFPGEVHLVYGRPGGGKTWFALHAIVEMAMAGKKVVIIDYESTEDLTRFRLHRLGLTAMGAKNVAYQKMIEGVAENSRMIADWVEHEGVDLVVVDSVARALAAGGFEENDNGGVARFMQALEPLRCAKTAILLIDHTGHQPKDPKLQSEMPEPRGASSKIDQVSVAYFFDQRIAWNVERGGHAIIRVRKDRFGVRIESEVACQMTVYVNPQGINVVLGPAAPPRYPGVHDQVAAEAAIAMLKDGAITGLAKAAKRLAQDIGRSEDYARDVIGQMVDAGFLRAESAGNGHPAVIELPAAA